MYLSISIFTSHAKKGDFITNWVVLLKPIMFTDWQWLSEHAIYLFHYSFLGAGDVWFSLRNTTYQNNSIVTLEDIGESEDALHCITKLTSCCRSGDTPSGAKGNWYFPNGTKVPGSTVDWNIFRSRGQRVVHLSRKRGGVDGVYHCEIPDTMNITQNVYIGVYTGSSGE